MKPTVTSLGGRKRVHLTLERSTRRYVVAVLRQGCRVTPIQGCTYASADTSASSRPAGWCAHVSSGQLLRHSVDHE